MLTYRIDIQTKPSSSIAIVAKTPITTPKNRWIMYYGKCRINLVKIQEPANCKQRQ